MVDDYSRFNTLAILKHKSEGTSALLHYQRLIVNQTGRPMTILRTDGEYTSHELRDELSETGTTHEMSARGSHHQNPVAERRIQTVLADGRANKIHSGAPDAHWPDCFLAGNFVRNHLPSSGNPENQSPFYMRKLHPPDLSRMRVFGCLCWPLAHRTGKFDSKTLPCIFVGYADDSFSSHKKFAWKMLPVGNQNAKLIISDNVIFNEKVFPWSMKLKMSLGPTVVDYSNPLFLSTQLPADLPTESSSQLPERSEAALRQIRGSNAALLRARSIVESHESKANSELQAESQSIPSSLQKITRAGKAYAVESAEELDFEDMAGLEFDDPRLSNKGPIPTTVPKSFKDAVSCAGHLWWVLPC